MHGMKMSGSTVNRLQFKALLAFPKVSRICEAWPIKRQAQRTEPAETAAALPTAQRWRQLQKGVLENKKKRENLSGLSKQSSGTKKGNEFIGPKDARNMQNT